MWDHNPYEPGTDLYNTQQIVNQTYQRNQRQPPQPINWPKGLGEWIAGMGCLFFVFGVLWSISAVTVIGHVILIVGMTLLGMAIAVAGYSVIRGPKLLIQLIGWAWRKNVLSRSIAIGALTGLGLGAWLGMSIHGGNILHGMVVVGVLGAVLGLVAGIGLILIRKSPSKVRPG